MIKNEALTGCALHRNNKKLNLGPNFMITLPNKDNQYNFQFSLLNLGPNFMITLPNKDNQYNFQFSLMKVRAKKHLGQHFLKDERYAERIVNGLLEKHTNNRVIEIGPGTGVLTRFLLDKNNFEFLALDVDEESVIYLKQNYPAHNDKFLLQDFLQFDLKKNYEGKSDIIGNFPYNISSQIMFRVLEFRNEIELVVGMFQKEVAQRIASPPGSKEYGILSVLLQAYFSIEYLFTVPPGSFQPPPKVKSGVIRLRRNNVQQLDCNEAKFFNVVKTAFNQRRKTLRNALKPITGLKKIESNLMELRAEQLSVEDFIQLTRLVSD
jgi:16S rRNA (adenine1518-N6/adenine1519-N6)-dimethyltransferase